MKPSSIILIVLAALILLLQIATPWRGRGNPGLDGQLDALKEASARVERTFAPRMQPARRDALYADWLRAVERARGWVPEGDRVRHATSS